MCFFDGFIGDLPRRGDLSVVENTKEICKNPIDNGNIIVI